jgi:hypothetical protein
LCDTFASLLFPYSRISSDLFPLFLQYKWSATLSHTSWPASATSFRSSNLQANLASQQMFELLVRTRESTLPQAPPSTFRQFHTTHAIPSPLLYRLACCVKILFANDLLFKDIQNEHALSASDLVLPYFGVFLNSMPGIYFIFKPSFSTWKKNFMRPRLMIREIKT